MPTFLTTPRMAPELAARIEASVRGERARPDGSDRKWPPLLVAIARLVGILAVVAMVGSVIYLRRRDRLAFEHDRTAFVTTVRGASASIGPEQVGSVGRIEGILVRGAGAYEGDVVASDLRPPGALAAALARSAVYLRGTVAQLGNPAGIAEAAATSLKDPLLVCLLEPPSARTEKAILAKVHDAFSNGAEAHSPNVRRFREAQVGLPYLSPPWAEKVAGVKTEDDLDLLRDEYQRAPIEGAKRALAAAVLVYAMDEAGEPGGATELDGERPHEVRIGIVDLGSGRALLRMRKRVDPSWISSAKRPLYASGIDGCAFAFDVREAVAAAK
jgi:hypothetical protein